MDYYRHHFFLATWFLFLVIFRHFSVFGPVQKTKLAIPQCCETFSIVPGYRNITSEDFVLCDTEMCTLLLLLLVLLYRNADATSR